MYSRWFLDGSDPDLRQVGLYIYCLFKVGGGAGAEM